MYLLPNLSNLNIFPICFNFFLINGMKQLTFLVSPFPPAPEIT